MIRPFAIFAKGLFYGLGKCSYSSGASTRIAKAILGVQSAGFALFMDRENAHTVVVHQQELLKQFLECKAPALHFFMDRENAHTVAVHMAAGCCCVFYERWRL